MLRVVMSMAFLVALLGVAQSTLAADRVITVTGRGQSLAQPDVATITVGVSHRDKSAQVAMDLVSEGVAAILAQLAADGIEPRDMQTRRLELRPLRSNSSSISKNGPEISGFSASNQVMVRVRDLDRLGEILGAVLESGANEFNGLSLGVADPAPLADAARRAAVADAMARAALLADAAGVALGPVQTISDQSGAPRPQMMEAAAARSGGVPVAGGEVSVEASVTMVFAIGE